MNKLNFFLTLFLLSTSINAVQAMDGDEEPKKITKSATFTNRTNWPLYFRRLETKPTSIICHAVEGKLEINTVQTITKICDSADQDCPIVFAYTTNLAGAEIVRLSSQHKYFRIDEGDFGLRIKEDENKEEN